MVKAIAEMFESLASGSLRINAMQEVFPTSWDMFLEYIKRF